MTRAARKTRDFDDMTVEEKILHVEDLWDRIASSGSAIPVRPAQRRELERRLADDLAKPNSGTPWPELRERIRSKGK